MQIKIGNRVITKWLNFTFTQTYDSVADAFSLSVYFNPADPADRALYVPGGYKKVEITNNGELLMIGTIVKHSLSSAPTVQAMTIGGYTRSGVIEDCQQIWGNSTQFNGMTLKEICEKVLQPFGLKVLVDFDVSDVANAVSPYQPIIEPDMTIKEFISEMCKGKNVVLSHDAEGNLLLSRANTNQESVAFIDGSIPVTSMSLNFDGTGMHKFIQAVGQANTDSQNASQTNKSIENPYVLSTAYYVKTVPFDSGFRPGVYKQSVGDANFTPLTERQYLSQELKNIELRIEIEGWELGGRLVRPNTIITVRNPDVFLYQPTRWFIKQVTYKSDNVAQTATIECVVPEAFEKGDVKNVFTGSNLTVDYFEGGAHAVITPFDQP